MFCLPCWLHGTLLCSQPQEKPSARLVCTRAMSTPWGNRLSAHLQARSPPGQITFRPDHLQARPHAGQTTCRPDHLQARPHAGFTCSPDVTVGHPEGAQAWIMVTHNLFLQSLGRVGVGGLGPVPRSQTSPTVHFSGHSRSSHACFLQEEHQSPT